MISRFGVGRFRKNIQYSIVVKQQPAHQVVLRAKIMMSGGIFSLFPVFY